MEDKINDIIKITYHNALRTVEDYIINNIDLNNETWFVLNKLTGIKLKRNNTYDVVELMKDNINISEELAKQHCGDIFFYTDKYLNLIFNNLSNEFCGYVEENKDINNDELFLITKDKEDNVKRVKFILN